MVVHGPRVLLDLVLSNRDGLVRNVKVGGTLGFSNHEMLEFRILCRSSKGWDCLGQSDHDMVEFLILGGVRRGNSKPATLDFRRADFELFRRLVKGVPWGSVLERKGVQDGWLLFMKVVLKS